MAEWLDKSTGDAYNNTCYIVAGGPSLSTFDWKLLTPERFVIAINRSYEKLPDAQIVYFTDDTFLNRHRTSLFKHKGHLVRGTLSTHQSKYPHDNITTYYLSGATGLDLTPGRLKHGSNSTYAAINLAAAHLGFKKIYLLGVDMQWSPEGKSHWHSGHDRIDPPHTYNMMLRNFDTIKEPLEKLGTLVYNVNTASRLNVFPKITTNDMIKNEKIIIP